MQAPLIIYDRKRIEPFINRRDGETKLGEKISLCESPDVHLLKESLSKSAAKYVLLGLPEDVGVRANSGRKAADGCWKQSFTSLMNIQSTEHLHGDEILLLGRINFSEFTKRADQLDPSNATHLKELRAMVEQIDDAVAPIIEAIVQSGKEAIVIGGGHNNAYGCIKGVSKALNKKINVINCDPHADIRSLEGRHSGNGFSYAMHDGFLNKYSVIGLHENYNSQAILNQLTQEHIHSVFFEDIFIRNKKNFSDAVQEGLRFISDSACGMELDMDAIENVASSAITPSGISANDARRYVALVAQNIQLNYFHIAEGAPALSGIADDNRVGKLVAYLVTDYVKSRNMYYENK